jgi:acyl-CoA thioesterase
MSEEREQTGGDANLSEFSNEMGIESLGVIDGATTLQLDLSQKHMSRANRAHGGVLFTLLDSALGRAILESLPDGRGCATVEIKINYFRPVQHGRITARGWKREVTRSLGYAEGEVVNEAGKVLAKGLRHFLPHRLTPSGRPRTHLSRSERIRSLHSSSTVPSICTRILLVPASKTGGVLFDVDIIWASARA